MPEEPVIVVVRIRAKPGSEVEVREALLALALPTRAEPGCLGSDVHEMTDEPTLFLLHESWRTDADLERHLMAAHVQAWIAQSERLLAEPMQLSRWRKLR
jgi:quinol monooxygenase YgiN